ncbi:MAG: hypothetical protein NTZ05_02510, partial [Chloroflexi bacterium]|nr:hypothetical protein [Chloroflexota bacterium]
MSDTRVVSAIMSLILNGADALWGVVTVLAGGAEAPWWRWTTVELGLLLLLVLAGAGLSAAALKLGGHLGRGFRWLPALVAAVPFGAVWSGYALVQSQAINLSAHPQEAQGVLQLTWGLPLTLAIPLYNIGGVFLQTATA